MKPLSFLLLLSLLPVGRIAAQGASDFAPDRPDQTESANIVRPDRIQIEGGLMRTSAASAATELLVRTGLMRGLELRLGMEADDAANVVDVFVIGGKVRLLNARGALPAAALLMEAKPSPRGEPAEAEMRLAFAHALADGLDLGYNIGATWDDVRRAPRLLYTLTPEVSITERLGAFIEAFGEGAWPSAAAGITYRAAPGVQLDASGGHALRAGGYFVSTGASFRLRR